MLASPRSSSKRSLVGKSVRFDAGVEVYEFAMELGDHPCCTEGPPVQLAPGPHQDVYTQSLDISDFHRNKKSAEKSSQHHAPRLSSSKRLRIVMMAGYSHEDIASAAIRSLTVRQNREETLKKLGWDRFIRLLKTTGKLPKGILKGVLGTTGDIIVSTGGLVKKIVVGSTQRTVQARTA